jgi:hypothetical protein
MLDHVVEDGEQCAQYAPTRHHRDLRRLALLAQPGPEGVEHRSGAHGAQRTHGERGAHARPTSPDQAFAARRSARPAVALERGDADQGGRLLVAQSA